MRDKNEVQIFTIGHSTHPVEVFTDLLKKQGITLLADIRRFPGSGKFPQFNQSALEQHLKNAGVDYLHLSALGGRRGVSVPEGVNRWKNPSFRAYAEYMKTPEFETGIQQLQNLGRREPTAYMCSEGVWWRCHRALVSDVLKARGWDVEHIMPGGQIQEHPYTSPARPEAGKVYYSDNAEESK